MIVKLDLSGIVKLDLSGIVKLDLSGIVKRELIMNVVLGIVFCLIPQGSKGVYMTALKVYGQDSKYYYVRSDGEILVEKSLMKKLYKIDRKLCKSMVVYNKKEDYHER